MILSDLQTSFIMPSCNVFLQKYEQIQKEIFKNHVRGNEHFQNPIRCGLMVHNNNQIGNAIFML
jgi:hypothetical protein